LFFLVPEDGSELNSNGERRFRFQLFRTFPFVEMQIAWRSPSATNAELFDGARLSVEDLGLVGAWWSVLEPQSVQQ